MQISVKKWADRTVVAMTMTGLTMALDAEAEGLVQFDIIKVKISDEEGTPHDQQNLNFGGQVTQGWPNLFGQLHPAGQFATSVLRLWTGMQIFWKIVFSRISASRVEASGAFDIVTVWIHDDGQTLALSDRSTQQDSAPHLKLRPWDCMQICVNVFRFGCAHFMARRKCTMILFVLHLVMRLGGELARIARIIYYFQAEGKLHLEVSKLVCYHTLAGPEMYRAWHLPGASVHVEPTVDWVVF